MIWRSHVTEKELRKRICEFVRQDEFCPGMDLPRTFMLRPRKSVVGQSNWSATWSAGPGYPTSDVLAGALDRAVSKAAAEYQVRWDDDKDRGNSGP